VLSILGFNLYRVIHQRGTSEFLFAATHYTYCNNFSISNFENNYTGCLKIREFRIQSVVGKDPVELEKYEKKIALPEEDISTLTLFNT
jgi:hypothetical protein